MEALKQIDEAVNAAFAEFRKEFGEDARLEEGEEFVTVFNNCSLIIGIENGTLKEKFIGGVPYKVDMTLAVYEGGADDEV